MQAKERFDYVTFPHFCLLLFWSPPPPPRPRPFLLFNRYVPRMRAPALINVLVLILAACLQFIALSIPVYKIR